MNKNENEIRPLIKEFFSLDNNSIKEAIDLGCGIGIDTIPLIKKGYKVLAIDKEDREIIIKENLNNEELERVTFKKERFEEISLPNTDLIVSNFALSFCSKECFDVFWKKVVTPIITGGYIVGNIFEEKDEWNTNGTDMIFLDRKNVLDKLIEFEVLRFYEKEFDGKTRMGKLKHWHIFYFIAKKR